MEPPKKDDQILLYTAWYKSLLKKLRRLAQPRGEPDADYVNARLQSYVKEFRGALTPQRLNEWDKRRFEALYAELTHLAEQTFFRRYDATVPYDHLIQLSVCERHPSQDLSLTCISDSPWSDLGV